jgi:hypothetical protein
MSEKILEFERSLIPPHEHFSGKHEEVRLIPRPSWLLRRTTTLLTKHCGIRMRRVAWLKRWRCTIRVGCNYEGTYASGAYLHCVVCQQLLSVGSFGGYDY